MPQSLSRWCLHFFPEYHSNLPGSILHDWLDSELEIFSKERGRRLCVLAPRGESKSSRVTLFYVLNRVASGKEPFIWISSDNAPLTFKHMARIALESQSNEKLIRAYPAIFGDKARYAGGSITFGNGVQVEGISTGQNPRGSIVGRNRPSLLVLDDPESEADSISPIRRERNMAWLDGAFLKSVSPDSNVIILGTAICPDCLVLNVAKRTNWHSKIFSAIVSWPANMLIWEQWKDLYLHAGGADDATKEAAMDKARQFYESNHDEMHRGAKVSWESRYPLEALMSEWAEDPNSFARERCNSPHDPSHAEWDASFFDYEGFWFSDWPENITQRIIACDPSKGATETGDYSAIAMLVRDGVGNWYCEVDMQRRNVSKIVKDSIANIHRLEKETGGLMDCFILEANAFQDLIGTLLVPAAEKEGIDINSRLRLYNNFLRKDVRIRRLTDPLNRHLIKFRRTPGTRMTVQQLKEFPNGAFDDGADVLDMACRCSIDLFFGTAKRK